MSIIVNKDTKVIVQGITGGEGTFHSEQMLSYGTKIVAGVTPGKGGQKATSENIPVYNSMNEAKDVTNANASIIFVPPRFAGNAIIEAAESGIETIVCISEGIPVRDMIKAKNVVDERNITLIGPNCPGIITVDECKLGIMPGFIAKKGNIGVISKSGTLTYEAADQVVKAGYGISTAIGIGGDPIVGTSTLDAIKLFMDDNDTSGIVMIGEIGGNYEAEASKWIKKTGNKKPVVGFIAGQTAPKGKRMGHAGAIIGGKDDTAEAKMKIMRECGLIVAKSPANIGLKLKEVL